MGTEDGRLSQAEGRWRVRGIKDQGGASREQGDRGQEEGTQASGGPGKELGLWPKSPEKP